PHLAKYQLSNEAARDAACDAEQCRHQTTHRIAARHNEPCKPADDEAHYQPTYDLAHLYLILLQRGVHTSVQTILFDISQRRRRASNESTVAATAFEVKPVRSRANHVRYVLVQR